MNYSKYLIKKITKSIITWIPIILIFIAIIFGLFMNNRTSQRMGLDVQIEDNINTNALLIETSKETINTLDKDSEEYFFLQRNIEESEELLESDKIFLSDYNNGNWQEVYQRQIENIGFAVRSVENNSPDPILLAALNRDSEMYKSLLETKLPFEDVDYPTTGLQYTMSLFTYLLPILLTLSIIFILSNLYGSSFYEGINMSILLPKSMMLVAINKIITGTIFALVLLSIIVSFTFILSSVFFGTGAYDYPILHYHLMNHELYFDSIGSTIIPVAILQILSIMFIVSFIYLVSVIFKNNMSTLFISSLILIGGITLTNIIQPLQVIAQFLPTTYISSFDVVTGVFQNSIENYQVSFNMGVIVLSISIILIIGTIFILQLMDKKKRLH